MLAPLLLTQLLADAHVKAADDGPSPWLPATHERVLDEVPCSWIWQIKQWIHLWSLPTLTCYLSNKCVLEDKTKKIRSFITLGDGITSSESTSLGLNCEKTPEMSLLQPDSVRLYG